MILAFIGDNSYAKESALKEFTNGFVGLHGAQAIDRFNGEDIDLETLSGATTTAAFLSQRRMVVVRDLSNNKLLSENFPKIADGMIDTTDLIIVETQVDGRSKYLQALKQFAQIREFTQLESDELVNWILSTVHDGGGDILRSDANYLIDRVGANQRLLANELEKLLIYDPQISRKSIEDLTDYVPQSSIFAMLEAAFNGNVQIALKLYKEQRLQGSEPQVILGMIVWQLHILALVKTGQDKNPNELASAAKLNPFVVRKSLTITKMLTFERLTELFKLAVETDQKLKTVKVNPDDAITTLLIACAQ